MVGVTVGNYKLTGKLGEGGMGTVYMAEHALIGRKAALKMIRPEYSNVPDVVNRFFNEAKSTAQIKHPCLVEIYDFGYHTNGSAYIVMEYLEGETLSQRIRRMRVLPSQAIVAIARQICSGLKAAHDKGIVHRDLKPDNIFVVPDSEAVSGERVKVLDFGIAKLNDEGVSKTRTGTLMGTPLYMAPEQCRGAQSVDYRADIYSLGCIIFEMACGRPPFLAEGFGEIIAAQIMQAPPKPTSIEPTVAPPIEDIILRALAKKPEDRQRSMAEISASLDGLFSGRYSTARFTQSPELEQAGAALGPTGTIAVTPKPTTLRSAAAEMVQPDDVIPKKRGRGLVVAAAAVVVVGGGLGVVMMGRGNKANETDKAPVVEKKAPPAEPAAIPPPAIIGAPAPVKVTHKIDSSPSGAEVFRAVDGVLIGTTPVSREMEKTQGLAAFVVRQSGYEDAKVQLPADRDGDTTVTLVKLKTASHHSTHTETKTVEKRTGGKSVLVDPFADDEKPKKKK